MDDPAKKYINNWSLNEILYILHHLPIVVIPYFEYFTITELLQKIYKVWSLG